MNLGYAVRRSISFESVNTKFACVSCGLMQFCQHASSVIDYRGGSNLLAISASNSVPFACSACFKKPAVVLPCSGSACRCDAAISCALVQNNGVHDLL